MTNLQQRQNEAGNTSLERWLLLGPVMLGGVLALGTAVGLGWPAWQELQKEQAQVDGLRQLEQQLPLLRRQLAVERERSEKAAQQQMTLQQLIAGSGTLATFMAQVDRLAASTGVRLDLYEPQPEAQPIAPAEGGRESTERSGDGRTPPPPKDPLLAEGLQKRSLMVKATGKFPQLLAFLRRLESLSVLVAQSDLNLILEEVKGPEAAVPAATAAPNQPPKPPTAPKAPPKTQVVLRMGVALYENVPETTAAAPARPAAGQP